MAKEITKKNNKRIVIVLAFILLVLLIGYIYFRGQYLEILEIGEKYTEIFWQNIKYTSIAFSINFIVLFLLISFFDMDSTQVYYRLMNYPDFYLSG